MIGIRDRLSPAHPDPAEAPPGIRVVAWLQRRLVHRAGGGLDLLPAFPTAWAGQGVEVHDATVDGVAVGFAVRWHGQRPALIWDVRPAQMLRCPTLDPGWASDAERGDALLAPFNPR